MARALRRLAGAILTVAISLAAQSVQAATLQISPVLVDLAPQQGATGILLRNPGTTPIYGQVRVYAWDQAQGDDVLTPTQEIQASPPIIQVPPNGEQLVRLVRLGKDLAPVEQSYRLVIDEIPDPSTPLVNGVVLRMRYSVPVFVAGATPEPAPALAWHLSRQGREWVLRLDNSGTRYAQVASMQLLSGADAPLAKVDGLLGYALARRERQWRFPAKHDAAGQIRIRALVNGSPVTITPRVD
ncbi:fimbrial biogenesis chaperone [Achromobacter ruhlandii]|uniref:Pili assembly chaperone N-terminal domain-containing protein n=1 Tax=Achromobacter ruhlandii TaxID=72557 RepID=A0ABM8LXW0_9BURK|nr:molecular chaperone [Achromobacter ruhlandii]AKP87844.1 Sigma-fimbriae chaperone protein [Achromobacter xylosoxidans]MCZ8433647.1 molecular chaperone [Achromobacter ruhlandii]MDC6089277.1 molecular chaperone [Achromobacter ruhlandii]MDC6150818.1 molecular chaperone [Achromobacter ruhlandii]MDD7982402.1 molecular chaperone [Achromobacter ruhlandii]